MAENQVPHVTLPPPPAGTTQNVQGTGVTGATSSYTTSDTVSSMADLKEKAPEVYNAMLQGIAMNICGRMKEHQARLKKIMREGRERASG